MNSLIPCLIASVAAYRFKSDKSREKLIKKRLNESVKYAKEHSPYFAELYKDVKEDFSLSDLPVVTKKMMMDNFDNYVTDREITMDSVMKYMSDKENRKKAYLGKYEVGTTSGSTGLPAIMVYDKLASNADIALAFVRNGYSLFPMANLCVDDGFGVDNSAIDQHTEKFPFIKHFVSIIDTSLPYEEMARQLNEYKPKLLIGYVGVMLVLADLIDAGKLRIKPKRIVVSGEYCSATAYERLKSAFKCRVSSVYASTEGGVMTNMCKCGHIHVNTDHYIIESVDENYNPVPVGVRSDRTLVTAFSRRAMPIIRYELTDRITIHDEPCACGDRQPWLQIDGRSNDFLRFTTTEGKECKIAPMVLYDLIDIECGEKIKNYQLVIRDGNKIECRLIEMDNEERQIVFLSIVKATEKYLDGFGIKIDMTLSDEVPQRDKRTGKFKQIYQEDKSIEGLSGRHLNFADEK